MPPAIVIMILSQYWARLYHPRWFKKYNYLLGGAWDGGAQITLFVLTFAVFGASGVERPFPSVSPSFTQTSFAL